MTFLILSPWAVFGTLFLLVVKHVMFDGPFQTSYQLAHKGTYGHWGGIQHALFHMGGTAVALAIARIWLDFSFIAYIGAIVIGGVVHYHVDWFKMRYLDTKEVSNGGLDDKGTPCLRIYRSPWFFGWLITDQACHHLTYSAIILFILLSW